MDNFYFDITLHEQRQFQDYTDECGGRFVPETIEELEPTFENEWDYEWWPEWPQQPAAASKPGGA